MLRVERLGIMTRLLKPSFNRSSSKVPGKSQDPGQANVPRLTCFDDWRTRALRAPGFTPFEPCHAALFAPGRHALKEGDRTFAISAVLSAGGVGLTLVVVIAWCAVGLKGLADP